MWRTFKVALLTAGLLILLPNDAGAQKRNKEKSEAATDQDYKQLQSVKDMTGKLASINTDSITLRLDIPHMVQNPKFQPPKASSSEYRHLQSIYHQQAQIMKTADPVQRQIRMQRLMASVQNTYYEQMLHAAAINSNPIHQPFMLAHQYKDYDLAFSAKVAVRKLNLDLYDDKGSIKTYTAEEKDRLRGDDKSKPGYDATIDDLHAGQQIKIYLRMPKKTKPATDQTPDNTGKDKADDKANADKAKADQLADKATSDKAERKSANEEIVKPVITMIVILQSADSKAGDGAAPQKKSDK